MNKQEIIKNLKQLLTTTSKESTQFEFERKYVFNIIKDIEEEKVEISKLDGIVELCQNSVKFKQIKNIVAKEIDGEEKIRKTDLEDKSKYPVFIIEDKDKKIYEFFSRVSANTFIKENKEKFESEEVIVRDDKNIDMLKVMEIIK